VILQDVTLEGATDRAVYVYSGTQQHVICRVLFQRNKNAVVKRGAALTVERGTNVLVVESRFVDNEASQGSGIYARGGTVEVYDSVFEDNVALERVRVEMLLLLLLQAAWKKNEQHSLTLLASMYVCMYVCLCI